MPIGCTWNTRLNEVAILMTTRALHTDHAVAGLCRDRWLRGVICMPCAGTSPFGWQLTQRGWRNARLASRNSARDRSPLSVITAKSATAWSG